MSTLSEASQKIDVDSVTEKLRVGLIVDSSFSSRYVLELAKWGQTHDAVVVTHLLILQRDPPAYLSRFQKIVLLLTRHGPLGLVGHIGFAAVCYIESILLRRTRKFKDHVTLFDLRNVVPHAVDITPTATTCDPVYRLSDTDMQMVKKLNLDVLVRCCSSMLTNDMSQATPFGVLYFSHSDTRVNRGGPPGFWEVYFKRAHTGLAIEHLGKAPHCGNALLRGRISTRSCYLLNQAALFTKSISCMKTLLADLASTKRLPPALETQPYYNPIYNKPNIFEQIRYCFDVGLRAASTIIRHRMHYRWGVAYCKSDWKDLVMCSGNKIANPAYRFLADPFVFVEQEQEYCLVEDYDFMQKKGCISAYKIHDWGVERLGEVINEPFHLSFPYLFRYKSKIYLCPESSENDDIRIYEAVKFPVEWKLSTVLMADVSAVDTMIFEHQEKWWMLTNIDSARIGDHGSELYIFYADSPLSQQWKPHLMNPVLMDSAVARNAGIVFDDSHIYRVSQVQGFKMYGEGLSLNKIRLLDEKQYDETPVCAVEPGFYKNIKGTHHLHCNGRTSVFDYVELATIKTGKRL